MLSMLLSSQLTLCRLELNVKVCYLHCELKLWQFLDPTDAMILMWQKTKLLITMSWYYLLYKLTILASLGVTHTKVYIYICSCIFICMCIYVLYIHRNIQRGIQLPLHLDMVYPKWKRSYKSLCKILFWNFNICLFIMG